MHIFVDTVVFLAKVVNLQDLLLVKARLSVCDFLRKTHTLVTALPASFIAAVYCWSLAARTAFVSTIRTPSTIAGNAASTAARASRVLNVLAVLAAHAACAAF